MSDDTPKLVSLLTAAERRRLSGHTGIEDRTIKRWASGAPVRIATATVLQAAALRLRLPVPERPERPEKL